MFNSNSVNGILKTFVATIKKLEALETNLINSNEVFKSQIKAITNKKEANEAEIKRAVQIGKKLRELVS
jgi:hypothetical protein